MRFRGNEITYPKVQSHIHLEPKTVHSPWGNTVFSICVPSYPMETNSLTEKDKIALIMSLVFLFLPCAHLSLCPLPLFYPHFNPSLYFFPKANMPCGTWSTGFQAGTTATMQQARPCRMTRWQPSAAPYMKWSPRTWRTPRPYGMQEASRSWLASPKAKEISKSDAVGRMGSKCARQSLVMGNTIQCHWKAFVSDDQENKNSKWFPVFPPQSES